MLDKCGIKEKIHIVLRGPDGEIKEDRPPETNHRKKEDCES